MDIKKCYQLPFSVHKVYAAWVSSDTIIPPATAMDILPKVGGHYRLTIDSPDFSSTNHGRFLLVKPNQHLRYTWEWNGDGEVTQIDVTFTAKGNNTEMTLVHSGFNSQSSRAMHDTGWDSYMQGLEVFLSNTN